LESQCPGSWTFQSPTFYLKENLVQINLQKLTFPKFGNLEKFYQPGKTGGSESAAPKKKSPKKMGFSSNLY